ncbi:MAG: TonB-dependent receptor plug domain-containing protein [Melioribacteraceae bacterium]|nr:TonB-dependent receptor plug domain-containing protein [Melioribacteraceae bacterium]
MLLKRFLYFLCFYFFSTSTFGQTDSIKTYNLNEITVKSGIVLEPKLITEINLKEIEYSDAASISDLARFIPSLKLQTNSRGESLFYMRGSNERQLALFFDGVPLNIPWDNRIDLSMVPTSAIGELTISKGIPSVIYGANTLAGVISIDPAAFNGKDRKKALIQIGENNSQKYSAFWIGGNEKFSHLTTFSYKTVDEYNLPDDYEHKLNKTNQRLNSYNSNFNFFSKFNYKINNLSKIGLSLSYIDSEKGVPPEMDVAKPRYWQYPVWQKFTSTINGEHKFGINLNSLLVYSLSFTKFKMRIDQFNDITYSNISEVEKDDDNTITGRVIYTKLIGSSSIWKFAFNGYSTGHEETIIDNTTNDEAFSEYRQNVFSFGTEYEFINDKFTSILGVGLDGVNTPKVGDNPDKDSEFDYSLNYSFIYSLNPALSLQLNLGRKTRFPSLREAYSEALGKFKINPDLAPEVSYTIETSLNRVFDKGTTNFNLFLIYLNDGIVKETLEDGRKIRVNKENIRSYGAEISSQYSIKKDLSISFNLTYLNSFSKNEFGEYKDTLEYKPQFMGAINFNYIMFKNFNVLFEANYVGREYSDQGVFKKMSDYFLVNTRFTYFFDLFNVKLESYIRVNNLFDKLYFTQWSLPEAGRQFWAGFSAEF